MPYVYRQTYVTTLILNNLSKGRRDLPSWRRMWTSSKVFASWWQLSLGRWKQDVSRSIQDMSRCFMCLSTT